MPKVMPKVLWAGCNTKLDTLALGGGSPVLLCARCGGFMSAHLERCEPVLLEAKKWYVFFADRGTLALDELTPEEKAEAGSGWKPKPPWEMVRVC